MLFILLGSNSDPNKLEPFTKLFRFGGRLFVLFGGVDGDEEEAEVADDAASL